MGGVPKEWSKSATRSFRLSIHHILRTMDAKDVKPTVMVRAGDEEMSGGEVPAWKSGEGSLGK